MIQFKTLSWSNLLSTGNQPTKIQLDQAATTLVLGSNGSGKSSILDALCFVLFKKPFRKIKLDQIVNTINSGGCLVETEFSIGTNEYKVRRGLKPAIFEILVDGKPRLQEAATKDDQQYLEEDILKVNYDAFIQTVILGNAKYVPFMQLDAAKRRSFIEHILDINVFSVMNDILKDRQTDIKTTLATIGNDSVVAKEQIVLIEGFIKKLEADQKKAVVEIQKQIDLQAAERVSIKDEITRILTEITKLQQYLDGEQVIVDGIAELQSKKRSLEGQRATLETTTKMRLQSVKTEEKQVQASITAAKERISFYEQTPTCSTCGQDIMEKHRNQIVGEKQAEIDSLEKQLAAFQPETAKITKDAVASVKKIDAEIKDWDDKIQAKQLERNVFDPQREQLAELQIQAREQKVRDTNVAQNIKKLETNLKREPGNIQEQTDKLGKFQVKLDRLELNKKEALETQQFYNAAGVMLKDSGIKAAIIRQYLPAVNKLTNKYLAALDFFVSFSLDEGFNETFKSRHLDNLQYHSFSQGEKLRIDLALLFAWREIARLKNSCSTNLLILDEVIDGSMDMEGTDLFIKLLNDNLQNSNVFVISHKSDAALDKFKSTLRFSREKNFSKLIKEL